jgi:hypothetical protein
MGVGTLEWGERGRRILFMLFQIFFPFEKKQIGKKGTRWKECEQGTRK